MKIKQEIITPERASALIANNYARQRLVRRRLVEYLTKIIANGDWDSDMPQPIMISASGELLDGQHRMHAVINANKAVMCWVAYGVPISCYKDIDCGIPRQLQDRVNFNDDKKRNKEIASIVTSWYSIYNHRTRPTPDEAIALYRKHGNAIDWVASQVAHEKGIGRVHVMVAMAEMYERDQMKAQVLADTLWRGDMKRPNGIRMREFLIASVTTTRCPRSGNECEYIYRVCVGFCKAEIEGKTLRRIRVDRWES